MSLPELHRIRSILEQERLFVVVSDAFLTETAMFADVVLPAALWGEKTGTFTNSDRTVHLSEQAVDPPGDARSDFDILCEFARRLELRTRSGGPLVHWTTPEEAFEAGKRCSAGRPCDYTGLSYDMLRQGGVQWPVNAEHPQGTERLYTDSVFWSDPAYCENYGHDFATGAANTREEYAAQTQPGKAFLRAAKHLPPHEPPSERYPLNLTTGRTVYHFHTRTKTRHAPELQGAAPSVWVELHPDDAAAREISEGDMVRVTSPRGSVEGRARLSGIRDGVVFVPFHYGYWDSGRAQPENGTPATAANEMTITEWDPVSKQPLYKVASVQVERVGPAPDQSDVAPAVGASAPVGSGR